MTFSSRLLVLLLAPLGVLLPALATGEEVPPAPVLEAASAPAAWHPHFPKRLEVTLGRGKPSLTLRYQTATFDEPGAKALPAGKSWHLAGATLVTTADLEIGGQKVKAGTWNLMARKTEEGGFELVLGTGGGFTTTIDEGAHVLKTQLKTDAPRMEHLSIDVHPAGDEGTTALDLVVRFHDYEGRARIVVP